jgi:NADH:ubiquinone oxidoreductase subunit 5 (subunit L)/multisubunit Na+/H+ antiporter MnhA subunit
LLFLAVGAVEYRTNGVRDLNSLGGLIQRMPVTFIAALIGACGLIGLPLTNGFVSKWLIYKTLILEQHPFLAFAALFGTWGTILYSYKLIHNIFLGQLPAKYAEMQKAPFSMQLPMIIMSSAILLFGILPGIPLRAINAIGVSAGFDPLDVTLWGIASDTGALNMINLFAAVIAACVVAGFVLRMGSRAVSVSQEDTYAAGATVPEGRYSYTAHFYDPLFRMAAPYLKDFIDAFYMRLAGWIQTLCDGIRRIYTGYVGLYVMYIVLFLAALIFTQLKWGLW